MSKAFLLCRTATHWMVFCFSHHSVQTLLCTKIPGHHQFLKYSNQLAPTTMPLRSLFPPFRCLMWTLTEAPDLYLHNSWLDISWSDICRNGQMLGSCALPNKVASECICLSKVLGHHKLPERLQCTLAQILQESENCIGGMEHQPMFWFGGEYCWSKISQLFTWQSINQVNGNSIAYLMGVGHPWKDHSSQDKNVAS